MDDAEFTKWAKRKGNKTASWETPEEEEKIGEEPRMDIDKKRSAR